MPLDADPWYKKTITHRAGGRTLSFRVSQALFSSHEIDAGTRLLLRSIDDSPLREAASVLDLGCGYGAIGITLAATHPRERVHMVDRDALAVAYAAANTAANAVDARAYGSLAYDDIDGAFDLIAMNIPGKAGDAVIRHLLRGAHRCLARGGAVAAVAVAPLAPLIAATLRNDPAIDVTHDRRTADYVTVHYRFAAPPDPPEPANAFDAGIYTRAHPRIDLGALSFGLTTAHGLPEFDQPSHATQLLLHELASSPPGNHGHTAVLNAGQGHAAVALHLLAAPHHLTLAGRDLLALRTTAANLTANGRAVNTTHADGHQTGHTTDDAHSHASGNAIASTHIAHTHEFPPTAAPLDLIAATIDDSDPIDASADVLAQATAALAPSGVLLAATTSTTAVRLAKRLAAPNIRITERTRRHRAALLAITRG
jgi:16S rRNA G1207 methylase RsmC